MTQGRADSGGEATALICQFARAQGLEVERGGRKGELVVVLPGDAKLRTVCSLLVGEHDVTITAFVIRNPDENHAEVYTYLLRRNLRMPGLAYAIDATGDVYVTGRIPLRALDVDQLDSVLGLVLEASDGAFNELLALGFLTSMQREWAWRTARRESLRSLEAFRHLLDVPGAGLQDDPQHSGPADTASRAHEESGSPRVGP